MLKIINKTRINRGEFLARYAEGIRDYELQLTEDILDPTELTKFCDMLIDVYGCKVHTIHSLYRPVKGLTHIFEEVVAAKTLQPYADLAFNLANYCGLKQNDSVSVVFHKCKASDAALLKAEVQFMTELLTKYPFTDILFETDSTQEDLETFKIRNQNKEEKPVGKYPELDSELVFQHVIKYKEKLGDLRPRVAVLLDITPVLADTRMKDMFRKIDIGLGYIRVGTLLKKYSDLVGGIHMGYDIGSVLPPETRDKYALTFYDNVEVHDLLMQLIKGFLHHCPKAKITLVLPENMEMSVQNNIAMYMHLKILIRSIEQVQLDRRVNPRISVNLPVKLGANNVILADLSYVGVGDVEYSMRILAHKAVDTMDSLSVMTVNTHEVPIVLYKVKPGADLYEYIVNTGCKEIIKIVTASPVKKA